MTGHVTLFPVLHSHNCYLIIILGHSNLVVDFQTWSSNPLGCDGVSRHKQFWEPALQGKSTKMDLNESGGPGGPLGRLAFPNQTAKDIGSVQLFHIDHGVKCPQAKTDRDNSIMEMQGRCHVERF